MVSTVAAAPLPSNGWRLYGDEGTLLAEGFATFTVYRLGAGAADPAHRCQCPSACSMSALGGGRPDEQVGRATRDFVADVRGKPHRPYLTFRDGWRYQEATSMQSAPAGAARATRADERD